ncbi:MAG TPA: HAD family hydrolase [Clostridiaceae bacterium]
MYKLLCVDLDGTLLNDLKDIDEINIEALKKVYKSGIIVALTTGRLFSSAAVYSEKIGFKFPLICSNGALIIEAGWNKALFKKELSIINCKKIISLLKKFNVTIVFNSSNIVFSDKEGYSVKIFNKLNENLPWDKKIKIVLVSDWDLIFNEYENEILKCIITEDELDKVSEIKKALKEIDGLEVVNSSLNSVEVMTKGVSKGQAVELLAKRYNISKDKIASIGDSENDISMFKASGVSIAMGNSLAYVKEIADYVTETNENKGLAKAIDRYILNN